MESITPRHRSVIQAQVREMLGRNHAWRGLHPTERQRIVDDAARVVETLADGRREARVAAPSPAPRDVWARSLADAPPADDLAGAPTPDAATGAAPRWRPDDRFDAEAINAGVRAAGNMLREVDFPRFVSSLVQGVFQSIVDASIQQMKAFGELVQSVSMSLSQFRDANVQPEQAGDALLNRYPHLFQIDQGAEGGPKLRAREDIDMSNLPDFQRELNLSEPIEDLEPETIDARLIPAMRDEVALGRQRLLATTLLMGINRIIVTDGKINAKVTFDFKAHDDFRREGVVNDVQDRLTRKLSRTVAFSDRVMKGDMEEHAQVLVASTEGEATGRVDANATLKGEVSINFRSETFPLERFASSDQIMQINAAQGAGRGAPPTPPAQQVNAPAAAPGPASAPAPAARA